MDRRTRTHTLLLLERRRRHGAVVGRQRATAHRRHLPRARHRRCGRTDGRKSAAQGHAPPSRCRSTKRGKEGGHSHLRWPREGGGTGRAMRRTGSGDPSEQRTNPLSSLRPSLRPGRMGFREEGAGANNDDVVNGLIYVFIVVICGLRTSHDEGDEGRRRILEEMTTTTLKFGSRRASA